MPRGTTTIGPEEIQPPPSNSKFLSFENSDGDASIRPSPTQLSRDATGRINYFRQVSLDEKSSTQWRRKIGSKVAFMLGKSNPDSYCLADWPEGYAFFDHNKERAEGDMRHDPYLYGSPHCAKFRSTNEFIPHAYWLMTTTTLNNSECACKYCAKKKGQKEVNESVLGEPSKPRMKPSAVQPPEGGRLRRKSGKSKDSYDSDSASTLVTQLRPSKPEQKSKHLKQIFPLNFDDIPPAGVYTPRKRYVELHSGRFVRDGELIWIRLPYPIYYEGNSGVAIDSWPAFAEDIEHRKQVVPSQDKSTFTVKEEVYIVTRPLMAGRIVVKVPETSVIPFRAWEVGDDLVELIKKVSSSSDIDLTSEYPVFDQRSTNGELLPRASFQHVAPYFAVAVQTAAHMDIYWSPMFQIANASHRATSISFQGLWLGAERIWLDDVVRVVPSHEDLTSHVQLRSRIPPPFEGSETRSILMRVNDISVTYILTPDGPRKVCRLSGPLFYTAPDPQYQLPTGNSAMLSSTESNSIPGIKNGTHFPFPIPPIGFQYQPLTPDDQEVVLDARMIAGRYYPRLILSPSLDIQWIQENRLQLWLSIAAMSGLSSSQYSRSNAQFLIRQRAEAAEASEKAARADFLKLVETTR
ncbi:hypothetical protein M408DRAFT_59947 [Serendipita vermifera MAFF 305830]|uniref:Cryptic loci regulator 2 N-terminal domain-containing protein n=1 Tax=Serendipita vermifera MAFF 305830 TaxID=933852 RepID=A0A0C2XZN7_SERVB|nr:hypothetical protein M408DRAFT_59947 [Serendipita vermifera MAFF 305830]